MKVVFDGKILAQHFLDDVDVVASKTKGKFDAVCVYGAETKVLKTLDTEADAKAWVNALGDKLLKAEGIEALDAR